MVDDRPLGSALGLTRDPFEHPAETFFSAGDRTRQLDELRQLSRGTRRLIAVTGDRGVGKSVMFRTLSSRLDPGVKAARINANLVNDVMGVLAGVLQGLGLPQPDRNKPDALAAAIVEHARAQGEASRYDLVMVDDAHSLELRALETLLRMLVATPQRGLRIVFFAETRFVGSLGKAVERVAPGLSWHEIRLTPFSRDEVRRYLRFRFAEVGWEDHLPFTEIQVQELIVDSGGLPGEIDELASELLSGPVDGGRTGWLPPIHRAALLLLLVVVGMTWLIWSYDDALPEPDSERRVAVPTFPEPARRDQNRAEEPGFTVAEADTQDPVETAIEEEPKPLGIEPAVAPPGVPAPEVEQAQGPETQPGRETAIEPEPLPGPLVATEPAQPEADPAPPVVVESAQPEADAAPPTVVEPARPEPTRSVAEVETARPEPDPVGVTAAVPEDPLPAPVQVPEPVPEPRPQASAERPARPPGRPLPLEEEPAARPDLASPGPVLRRGAKDTSWVLRQPPERYTLQLFGTSNRDRMVAYVNRQDEISEFAFLTLERDGQPWYVVTYGVFSSPGAARTAAENLPETVGRVDPWVRSFSAVQAHVRQADPGR